MSSQTILYISNSNVLSIWPHSSPFQLPAMQSAFNKNESMYKESLMPFLTLEKKKKKALYYQVHQT